MSVWTHVAVVVRVDALRFGSGDYRRAVEVWFQDKLPCGSEGPLTVTVWENPNLHHISAFTVTIHGDLRDFHSTAEVIEWLNDRCMNLPRMLGFIRQAGGVVETEGRPQAVWEYQHAEQSPDDEKEAT